MLIGSFSPLLLFQSNEERHFSVYFVQLSLWLRFEVDDLERSSFCKRVLDYQAAFIYQLSALFPLIAALRIANFSCALPGPTVSLAGKHFKLSYSIDFGQPLELVDKRSEKDRSVVLMPIERALFTIRFLEFSRFCRFVVT